MLTNNNRGNPEFGNLPRKFNIAVSGSRDDYAHTHINDIGLQAIEKDGTSVVHRLGRHRGRQAGGPSSLSYSSQAPCSAIRSLSLPFLLCGVGVMGFNVVLGGYFSTKRVATSVHMDLWVPADQAVNLCYAILLVRPFFFLSTCISPDLLLITQIGRAHV